MKTSTRSVRSLFIVAAAAMTLTAGVAGGCDRSDSDSTDPDPTDEPAESKQAAEDGSPIDYPDGPKPTPDTIVAQAGDVTVTFGEYEAFLRQSRLFRPGGGTEPISKTRLARPRAQVGAVRSLLRSAVIEAEVKRRGLTPSQSDVVEFLTQDSKWSPYAGHLIEDQEAEEPLPEGVKPADLEAIARRALNRKRLQEDLLEKLDGEKIWEIYQRRHDRISLLVAGVDNSPSPENIDAYIDEHGTRPDSPIRAYYEANKRRFGAPRQVTLTMLVPKGKGDESDVESTLKKAAKRLAGDAKPKAIAGDLNLELRREQHLVKRENREAYGAERGETGYQTEGPRGAYAWRVEGWREPQPTELKGRTLREVASEAMQKEVVPSARETIEKAEAALREVTPKPDGSVSDAQIDTLKEQFGSDAVEVIQTGLFPKRDQGRVPKIGLAEPIVERAFEMGEPGSVTDEPILSRGRVYAFRILERETPSREAFEAEREAFREKIIEAERDSIVATFMSGWMEKNNPDVNLEPIQVKYGVIKKKG
jgi:hypothetical protein